jgi:DNA-binding PadR family transcriptional regulator
MEELTGLQRDLLYAVAGLDSPHGLAVKEAIDPYVEGEIEHGRLYPNLDRLVERGLVEKGSRDERTNAYRLTDAGREALEARRAREDRYLE